MVRVTIMSTFYRVDIPANIVLEMSRIKRFFFTFME